MLNLEHLHQDFGQKSGRASGRTVDMLVEVAHQTGSCALVSVVARDYKHAEALASQFLRLAEDIGYEAHRNRRTAVSVSDPEEEGWTTTVYFQPKEVFVKRYGSTEEVFTDHYANV